ncbi:transcriptional regulator [Paecilomyces lecythidis]|uniref:Transcriptional regulator n=1 Tax=Paecilomyces lecythidis TaxID=3004212 RepID=A0ABR3YCH7_9EURO
MDSSLATVDSSCGRPPKSPATWAKVVAASSEDPAPRKRADSSVDNIGPGPQPLRGMSGFPAQQQAQARNATLASARLPNGKIGNAANWNFGLPMGGAPGLQNNQQRNMGNMGSFAQSLGGSQPATPLDLSEFPSLSGAPPQSQSQPPGQAVWANASQRATQQTPVQRQQPPSSQAPARPSQTQSHLPQQQSQPSHEDLFPSGAQFANRLDDFRNGGRGISGQLGASSQPQTGNIEEFPPLGRNIHGDLGQERRESLLQNAGFGNYASNLAFSGVNQTQSAQTRNMMAASINGQETARIMSPTAAGTEAMLQTTLHGEELDSSYTGISASRSPINQGSNGILGQDKEDLGSSITSNQRAAFTEQATQAQLQQMQQRQQQTGSSSAEGQDPAGAAQSAEQPPLSQMSEIDRFGLAGLLRMIHSESPDVASLAVGQDLMTLGLDLNQPEPLHPSFASPFVSSMSTVPLEQDYSLPSCYAVANIQPLQSRIPSFSDETLFYIFYSMPRDIMQELVAEELMGRKWRYHKVERCWLTRDETYPGPVDVERGVSERGVYLWWDAASWKKIRREFILRYEDLDNRLDPNRSIARTVGFPPHAS